MAVQRDVLIGGTVAEQQESEANCRLQHAAETGIIGNKYDYSSGPPLPAPESGPTATLASDYNIQRRIQTDNETVLALIVLIFTVVWNLL